MKDFIQIGKRKLHQDLIDLIDQNIKPDLKFTLDEDGAYEFYIKETCMALSKLKILESGGNNKGDIVGKIQGVIGPYSSKGDGLAWCMSLVQVVIAYVEYKTGKTSQLFPSEGVVDCFNKSKNISVSNPQSGDIFIWKTKGSWTGHAGIIMETFEDGMMKTFEGNTGSGDAREGDGAYIKKRSMKGAGKLEHYGYLRPFMEI